MSKDDKKTVHGILPPDFERLFGPVNKEQEFKPCGPGALSVELPPKGWQCPFCLVVHAPHITECFCQQIGTTTDKVLLTEDPEK